MYLIDMEPMYPNFTPYIATILFIFFVYFGPRWWQVPMLLLSLLGVCWTRFFLYPFLRWGLRKSGYKGKAKWISRLLPLDVAQPEFETFSVED